MVKKTFKRPTKAKTTVLIIGEGSDDKAFLSHLNRLYNSRYSNVKITIKDAHGGGPPQIIDCAIRQSMIGAYDIKAILMDTDITLTKENNDNIKEHSLIVIGSDPCLEGLLLDILGQKKDHRSAICKKAMHKQLNGKANDLDSYTKLFTEYVLEKARKKHPSLNRLLNIYIGKTK